MRIARLLLPLATGLCLAAAAGAQAAMTPPAMPAASAAALSDGMTTIRHEPRGWWGQGWSDRRDSWGHRRGIWGERRCESRRPLVLHGYWERTPGGCTWRMDPPSRR